MGRLSKYANRYDIKARAREMASASQELVERARHAGEEAYATVGRTVESGRELAHKAQVARTIRRNPGKVFLLGVAAGFVFSQLLSRSR